MKLVKEHKKTLILTSIIILLPILIGVLLWDKLPAEIPTHFGMNGQPDDWSSKEFAVFVLPLFLLGVHWLCLMATYADPKYSRIPNKIMKLVLWICPFVSLFMSIVTYGYTLYPNLKINLIGYAFVGILFIITGNYLPKCRQNYTVGIKLPWTLHDEENWNRTHRMAGWLWIIGGISFIVASFFDYKNIYMIVGIMILMTLIPVIYSYVYHIRHHS